MNEKSQPPQGMHQLTYADVEAESLAEQVAQDGKWEDFTGTEQIPETAVMNVEEARAMAKAGDHFRTVAANQRKNLREDAEKSQRYVKYLAGHRLYPFGEREVERSAYNKAHGIDDSEFTHDSRSKSPRPDWGKTTRKIRMNDFTADKLERQAQQDYRAGTYKAA